MWEKTRFFSLSLPRSRVSFLLSKNKIKTPRVNRSDAYDDNDNGGPLEGEMRESERETLGACIMESRTNNISFCAFPFSVRGRVYACTRVLLYRPTKSLDASKRNKTSSSTGRPSSRADYCTSFRALRPKVRCPGDPAGPCDVRVMRYTRAHAYVFTTAAGFFVLLLFCFSRVFVSLSPCFFFLLTYTYIYTYLFCRVCMYTARSIYIYIYKYTLVRRFYRRATDVCSIYSDEVEIICT